MKHLAVFVGIGALAVFASAGLAQQKEQKQPVDVSGVWEITSDSPRGTMTRNVTFEQDGSKLTGSIEARNGSVPIQKGSVDGNKISFTVVFSRNGNSFEMNYTGTVEGDSAKGTFQTPRGEVPWTGKRVKKE